jgi:anti-sigma B factor antagonist
MNGDHMNIWQEPLGAPTAEEKPIWLVGARGRLDQTLTPQLEQNLLDLLNEGHSRLLVDLTEVEYINSGGLRCLVSAWRRARQQEGSLSLCGLNPRLSEIFDMVGFDKVFDIYPTCEAARSKM